MIPAQAVEAAARFLGRYAASTGMDPEKLLNAGRVVATCVCGDDLCEGFQVIPDYCVTPRDTVLIRKVEL